MPPSNTVNMRVPWLVHQGLLDRAEGLDLSVEDYLEQLVSDTASAPGPNLTALHLPADVHEVIEVRARDRGLAPERYVASLLVETAEVDGAPPAHAVGLSAHTVRLLSDLVPDRSSNYAALSLLDGYRGMHDALITIAEALGGIEVTETVRDCLDEAALGAVSERILEQVYSLTGETEEAHLGRDAHLSVEGPTIVSTTTPSTSPTAWARILGDDDGR